MAQFKSLGEIQAYLEKHAMDILWNSGDLERVLANEMSQAVVDMVYEAYEPQEYERRGNASGLSDTRNMVVTDVTISGNAVKLTFENLTEGADSMKGLYITDTIENGIRANWDTPGAYSEPRPFVAETANRLKANPSGMINAIKQGLIEKGMKLK